MNVWIINHFANSPLRGSSTRHFALARRLTFKGHRVTIIAGSHDHLLGAKTDPFEGGHLCTVENGVPFVWVRSSGKRSSLGRISAMFSFGYQLLRLPVTVFTERPDVIVGSSPHPFAALAGLRLARRHNVPFVLEVRDLWPDSLTELGSISAYNPFILLLSAIEKHLYKGAKHIITLLPSSEQHIRQRSTPTKPISVIPNGIDSSLISAYAPPPQNGIFKLVYAGAHGKANDLDVLLDAAKDAAQLPLLKNVRFQLIGDGPEKLRLIARANTENIRNVEFFNPVPKKDIFKFFQCAHAFILPLMPADLFTKGVSPNKLFDYMASARPTIFAVKTGSNPIKASGGGICVEAGNKEAVIAGITKLLELTREEREQMGLRAREHVLENYSFDLLGDRFESTILSACENHSSVKKAANL